MFQTFTVLQNILKLEKKGSMQNFKAEFLFVVMIHIVE